MDIPKDQYHTILESIRKLSQSQGKMTLDDIKEDTGISNLEEVLNQLRKRGIIYYVNSTEFKLTPY